MLRYDATEWLRAQEGMPALRARRKLGIERDGDEKAVAALELELSRQQLRDGSFEESVMKTAGVLNMLADLGAPGSQRLGKAASTYLVEALRRQPGYERAAAVKPGGLTEACDLCGFFGPYKDRNRPDVLASGAREMNIYREFDALLAPKSPVRSARRSSLDRAGPGSCFAWGLIPLSFAIEALCRAGYARDAALRPATNALLGAQRKSGGWCRGDSGHPSCTIHAIRALGAHPELRKSVHADRALAFLRAAQNGRLGAGFQRWCRGTYLFAVVEAASRFELPVAREIIADGLAVLSRSQRKNGSFGKPCEVERVAAVIAAMHALQARRG